MSYSCIASNEFATLCQSQLFLLNRGLGAVWSAVYLTKELADELQPQLFPFAIYPQQDQSCLPELPFRGLPEIWQQLTSDSPIFSARLSPTTSTGNQARDNSSQWKEQFAEPRRLILPLVYQDTVMGLLVTGRKDRDWREFELTQIEEIARTIAVARFLEIKQKWTQEQLIAQKNLRRIEHDRRDNLLHQLRNPLTAIKTFSKLLLKRLLPEDRNYSVVTNILRQSERFQDLLQQFEAEIEDESATNEHLTLSTTSVPLLEEDPGTTSNFLLPELNSGLESVNVKDILEPLLITMGAIAEERNIQLIENIGDNLPTVRADFKALREVLSNLIDNALKYTPAGGKVGIEIKLKPSDSKPEMLGIEIKDTGYGIEPKDHERIFERHYRGVQAQSDIPGSGLGLAIAKELIERMHGNIELISPNHWNDRINAPGTTFIVWLPLSERR